MKSSAYDHRNQCLATLALESFPENFPVSKSVHPHIDPSLHLVMIECVLLVYEQHHTRIASLSNPETWSYRTEAIGMYRRVHHIFFASYHSSTSSRITAGKLNKSNGQILPSRTSVVPPPTYPRLKLWKSGVIQNRKLIVDFELVRIQCSVLIFPMLTRDS
jgi:hypothetical protein